MHLAYRLHDESMVELQPLLDALIAAGAPGACVRVDDGTGIRRAAAAPPPLYDALVAAVRTIGDAPVQ